jgi:hypothetical protein
MSHLLHPCPTLLSTVLLTWVAEIGLLLPTRSAAGVTLRGTPSSHPQHPPHTPSPAPGSAACLPSRTDSPLRVAGPVGLGSKCCLPWGSRGSWPRLSARPPPSSPPLPPLALLTSSRRARWARVRWLASWDSRGRGPVLVPPFFLATLVMSPLIPFQNPFVNSLAKLVMN